MDHSITVLSPKTPSSRGDSEMSFPLLYQTPRSEGFLKHKVILDTPSSSEFSFKCQTTDCNGETPSISTNTGVIPERKFYKCKRSILFSFEKSNTEQKKRLVTASPRTEERKAAKRKRSKSLDYRNNSKLIKLNKNVRHGVRRPKPRKNNIVGSSAQKNVVSNDPQSPETHKDIHVSSPGSENASTTLLLTPMDVKSKVQQKNISVKVNKLVRMNLQCGEIKFTKSTFSPKKTPKKKSFEALDVPETENWLKSKVDNILSSLDDENGEMEISGAEGHCDDSENYSIRFNDSTGPLSDAFHDLGVKEIDTSIDPPKENDRDISHSEDSHEHFEVDDGEPSVLFEDLVEIAEESANVPSHEVLTDRTVNADMGDSGTPNKKYFPVFYKPINRNSKENLINGGKSPKEMTKFAPKKFNDGMEQLIIDAGQKSLGPSTCPECGFFYQKGDHDEENMHIMYHGSLKPGIKHLGWKWERVAVKCAEGRVIRVCGGDPKTWWAKVHTVLEKANDDLGITFTSKIPKDAQAYMYVGDGYILGCVIAEPVRVVYRMLECDRKEMEKAEIDENDKVLEMPKVPSFCSNTPVRGSRCGINRMWTCASERRKGIATKILDAIRVSFVYGRILRLDEIAFSDPTPLGMAFAQKYTKTASFFVYRPKCE